MEVEVRYKDPTGRVHTSVVKTTPKLFNPESINRAVFRAGKQLIYTSECPYWGTQIRAKSFRFRPLGTSYEKTDDFYWNIKDKPGAWSRWYDYQQFFDESFPTVQVVTTTIKTTTARRHA